MIELRPYQRTAVDSLFDYFLDGGAGHPLVVAPTGSGKSVLIASFSGEVLEHWPKQRILILAHRKELLEQNAMKILRIIPGVSMGVYSAGMGSRQLGRAITMAGIQSVHRRARDIGWISLVIIDEAHLIPSAAAGMYRRLLEGLTAINPQVRVIGFTATPFRMGTGMLTDGDGRLFTDIAYDIGIGDLVRDGYLAPLVSKAAVTQADLSHVRLSGGEFVMSAAEEAMNRDVLTEAALDEVARYGSDRRKWLVFCAGVAHAERVAEVMNRRGIETRCITGDTIPMVRDAAIAQFRRGSLRALTNCDVLTTGFDAPEIDLIVLLRPTKSAGLYCLDEETEILTSHGWKNKDEVQVGDCAAAMRLTDNRGCWSPVTGVIHRELLPGEKWIEYQAPRANFRVTDNHNLIVSTQTFSNGWSPWRLELAGAVAEYKDSVRMPTAIEIEQVGVPLTSAELYFIGMIMTDGSFSSHQASIYQSERHPEILERIEQCLTDCGLAYTKTKRVNVAHQENYIQRFPRWTFSISAGKPKNSTEGSGFRHLMPYLDKDFAPALMALSKKQFFTLLQAIHDGDGYKTEKCPSCDWTPRSWSVCSGRKLFIERLQALAAINGCTAHLRWEHVNRINPIAILSISPQAWRSVGGSGNRPHINVTEPENRLTEKAWCVQADAGTIVTRRRGKVTVMGNCQMLGRGMRTAAGKENCLVMDFAGNVERHGPIDMIRARAKRQGGTGGVETAPVKICPECREPVALGAAECACGFRFPEPEVRHQTEATSASPMAGLSQTELLQIDMIEYRRHQPRDANKRVSMRVTYITRAGRMAEEWICFEHDGFAGKKARRWWVAHGGALPIPRTVDEALARRHELHPVAQIAVRHEEQFDRITTFTLAEHRPASPPPEPEPDVFMLDGIP